MQQQTANARSHGSQSSSSKWQTQCQNEASLAKATPFLGWFRLGDHAKSLFDLGKNAAEGALGSWWKGMGERTQKDV